MLLPNELTLNSIEKKDFCSELDVGGVTLNRRPFKKKRPMDCKTTFNGLAAPRPKIPVPYKG